MNVPHGELRVVDDVPAAFVELVLEKWRAHQGGRRFTMALSGGDTARTCYEKLATAGGIHWPDVECLLGDERCVPPDDDDANQKMIRAALVDNVDLGAFHPMDCTAAEEYDALVADTLPIDVVHLGLGPDGHTASLFPGSSALDSPPGRLVVHNSDPNGNNPHERLTFTFEAIARSTTAVFTVSGSGKHDSLHRILDGEPLPAARVTAGEVVWLCDRDALGEDIGRVR